MIAGVSKGSILPGPKVVRSFRLSGRRQPSTGQHFIAEGADLPRQPDKGLNQEVQPFQETVPIAAHPWPRT